MRWLALQHRRRDGGPHRDGHDLRRCRRHARHARHPTRSDDLQPNSDGLHLVASLFLVAMASTLCNQVRAHMGTQASPAMSVSNVTCEIAPARGTWAQARWGTCGDSAGPVMARVAVLSSLLLVACGQNNEVGDENCPCPAFQQPSDLCLQCHSTRCDIGGSALGSWLQKQSWGTTAGQAWTRHCQKLSKTYPHMSTQALCQTTTNPCGSVCATEPIDSDCHSVCNQNVGRAAHACSSFPWPTPIKTAVALQHLPDVFT